MKGGETMISRIRSPAIQSGTPAWQLPGAAAGNAARTPASGARTGRADGFAGDSLSRRMRLRLRQLGALEISGDKTSLTDVVNKAIDETQNIIGKMEGLADKILTGDYDPADRGMMMREYQKGLDDIDGIGRNTTFNGRRVFAASEEAAGELHLTEEETRGYLGGLAAEVAGAATDDGRAALAGEYTERFAAGLAADPGRGPVTGGYAIASKGGGLGMRAVLDRTALGLEGTNLSTDAEAGRAREALAGARRRAEGIRTAYLENAAQLEEIIRPQQELKDAVAAISDADAAREAMARTREAMLAQVSRTIGAHGGLRGEQALKLL